MWWLMRRKEAKITPPAKVRAATPIYIEYRLILILPVMKSVCSRTQRFGCNTIRRQILWAEKLVTSGSSHSDRAKLTFIRQLLARGLNNNPPEYEWLRCFHAGVTSNAEAKPYLIHPFSCPSRIQPSGNPQKLFIRRLPSLRVRFGPPFVIFRGYAASDSLVEAMALAAVLRIALYEPRTNTEFFNNRPYRPR
jgi:hypothetical protein